MVNREDIIDYLKKVGCPQEKIDHSKQVADLALKISGNFERNGYTLNLDTIEAGALLHDVGISRTADDISPEHCVLGADMARKDGYGEEIARCIETHEMCGVTKDEAKLLNFPKPLKDSYLPEKIEEKIVAYSDLIIFMVVEANGDPWNDPETPSKTLFPYLNNCYRKITGKNLAGKHLSILGNILKRANTLNSEYIKFVDRDFLV